MHDIAPAPVRARFLEGMSQAACTVSVVTTDGHAGRVGVTISSMSAVSADGDAPTLLVCINTRSPAAAAIAANGLFCINVLSDRQAHISDTFAGRSDAKGSDKFSCAEWDTTSTGAPRLIDPLVAFDCILDSQMQVGSHLILIGMVKEIFLAPAGSPLIYANRCYATAQSLPRALN